jgi:hypothetical protein
MLNAEAQLLELLAVYHSSVLYAEIEPQHGLNVPNGD